MSPQELMRALEGHQFAAEVNLAGGSEAFYRGLRSHRLFCELMNQLKQRSTRELVLARLLELSREPIRPEYENPYDAAMTAYLVALEATEKAELVAAAAEAVSKAPNCWWASGASARLLAAENLRRSANVLATAASGIIESSFLAWAQQQTRTPLGGMNSYSAGLRSWTCSVASRSARRANPLRGGKRARRPAA